MDEKQRYHLKAKVDHFICGPMFSKYNDRIEQIQIGLDYLFSQYLQSFDRTDVADKIIRLAETLRN